MSEETQEKKIILDMDAIGGVLKERGEEGVIIKSEMQGLTVCLTSRKHDVKELTDFVASTLLWTKNNILNGDSIKKKGMPGVS